eukprot:14478481-Alexandrium_andersonii.AAC.1
MWAFARPWLLSSVVAKLLRRWQLALLPLPGTRLAAQQRAARAAARRPLCCHGPGQVASESSLALRGRLWLVPVSVQRGSGFRRV